MASTGSSQTLPDPPGQLKAIQCYMKVAQDIERVDPVVAYWVRLYSTETALRIDKDSPECKSFLSSLIIWLENFKSTHKENEAVSNQTVGQAHMENFVVALFNKADTLDRNGTADKTTVRMFYMAAVLFEAMAVFGQPTEEITRRAKYAKFKAAYIQKCLKTGQVPKPGPIEGSDLENPSDLSQQPAGTDSTTMIDPPSANQSAGGANRSQDPFIMTPSTRPVYPPSSRSETTDKRPTDTPSKPPVQHPLSEPGSTCTNDNLHKSTITATKFHATDGTPLSAEDMLQSQKYCKFANSALQYDDIPTAVANLEKALKLLTTGQQPD